MKKIIVLVMIFLSVLFLYGCGSSPQPKEISTTSSASWAFEFVVYNGDIYTITDNKVTNIGNQIGEVTHYSDQEGTYSGNFSNKYPTGTKYYEIQGTDTKKSIAIKLKDGSYVRADYRGKYGAK